jgi:hypothetical protein
MATLAETLLKSPQEFQKLFNLLIPIFAAFSPDVHTELEQRRLASIRKKGEEESNVPPAEPIIK